MLRLIASLANKLWGTGGILLTGETEVLGEKLGVEQQVHSHSTVLFDKCD